MKNTGWIIGAVLIILVAAAIFKFGFTEKTEITDMNTFAKCITESGAKLYGAEWCPHCQTQKENFGESLEHIEFVECASEDGAAEVCILAGVEAYPTWIFGDGSKATGVQTFEKLAEKTGCDF
jgi:predicted DsbA family dithiol-disulfide isomerase